MPILCKPKNFKEMTEYRIKTLAVVTTLKLPRNTHTFWTVMYLVFRVKLPVKHKGPAAGHPWQRCPCKEKRPPAVPHGMQRFSFHSADPECHSKGKPNSSSLYLFLKNVPKLLVLIMCLNFSLKGKIVIVLISLLSTWHSKSYLGRGAWTVKIPPSQWPVDKSGKNSFINDWCGRTQAIVGDGSPGQVVLGGNRKQAEQPVNNIPLL